MRQKYETKPTAEKKKQKEKQINTKLYDTKFDTLEPACFLNSLRVLQAVFLFFLCSAN